MLCVDLSMWTAVARPIDLDLLFRSNITSSLTIFKRNVIVGLVHGLQFSEWISLDMSLRTHTMAINHRYLYFTIMQRRNKLTIISKETERGIVTKITS